MNAVDELRFDRERRLLNQRAFPHYFVNCSCEQGCAVCAYTSLVSRAEGKQVRHGAESRRRFPRRRAGG